MKIIRILENELRAVGINENVFETVKHNCLVGSEIVFAAVNLECSVRVDFAIFNRLAKCGIVVVCLCVYAENRSVDGLIVFLVRSCNVENGIIYTVNTVVDACFVGCRFVFKGEIFGRCDGCRLNLKNRGNEHQK